MTIPEFFDHPENRTLQEVIVFVKGHPEMFDKTPIGRSVIACIKRGNTKRLRRYWLGVAVATSPSGVQRGRG